MAEKIVFTERLTTFYKYPSVCLYQDEIENPGDFLSFLKTPSTQRRQQMIYIHIPFCTSMCLYCPFYKVNYRQQDRETIDRGTDGSVRETVISLLIGPSGVETVPRTPTRSESVV